MYILIMKKMIYLLIVYQKIQFLQKKGQTQANFLCSVGKNKNSYLKSLNYDTISVSISTNNELINDVSDLNETMANPKKTDKEMKK